jgi:hypothetical protein
MFAGVDHVRVALCVSCLLASACVRVAGSDTGAAESATGDESGASTSESSGVEAGESGTDSESSGSSEGESTGETTGETTDTSTGETTDTSTDTSGEPPEACACIVDQPGGDSESPQLPICGELLCPEIVAQSIGLVPVVNVNDPDALECAITALRDRSPGQLAWTQISAGDLQQSWYGYVLINEDGSVIRRTWFRSDVNLQVGDAEFGELEPPETYDACLQNPDISARFFCLETPLASVDAVCDEGWSYPPGP